MGDRSSDKPGLSFKDVIFINNAGGGVDATLRDLETGGGAKTPIDVSTKVVRIKAIDTSTVFVIQDSAGNDIFTINPSTKLITADNSAKFVGDGSLLTDLPGTGDLVNVTKYYRLKMTNAGVFTEEEISGFAGAISIARVGTTITLTSADGEFTLSMFGSDTTNLQTMYYNSPTEYKILLHPDWASNWAYMIFTLKLES